jgi:hypothetical protein
MTSYSADSFNPIFRSVDMNACLRQAARLGTAFALLLPVVGAQAQIGDMLKSQIGGSGGTDSSSSGLATLAPAASAM